MSSDSVSAAVVGGLIVRNGRHRGTRVPLKLPVTVIGSGEQCDVRIGAEGIEALHCVVAVTPAGPTVRSWHAASTLVNGHPTTAAVLKHGDELKVGPCSFRMAWFGELNAAEPEEPTSALAIATGPDWSLTEREQSLHEQEKQLSALLEGKQQQIESLLGQLQENREQFYAERDGVKQELTTAKAARREAERQKKATEQLRAKHHSTYRKLVLRAKRVRVEGEQANAAMAKQLDRQRLQLEQDLAAFETTKTRFLADATSSKQRLQDAWQMMETGNRRLLSDRQEMDRHLAESRKGLDQYAAELNHREQTITEAHAKLETRCAELQAELIGLDRRATHAQIAVQDLEHQRITLEATTVSTHSTSLVPMQNDLVPLSHRKDRSFDELMADLTTRERELDRDLKAVAIQRGEFERLSGELADQRAVLLAQFNKLAAAARLWQQAECANAGELERLATDLEQRERTVIVREQRLLVAEDQCRQRERDLWAFRVKLEGWQAGLTAHESQWYAHRDVIDSEADRQRENLAKWEASLQSVVQTWTELRSKERETLLAEIASWQQEREEYVTARKELDDERLAMTRQATLLAARMTATEEAASTVDSKRLRVLQKKWESHFRRFEKLWDARHTATAKLAKTLDSRIETIQKQAAKLTSETIQAKSQSQQRDIAKITNDRKAAEQSGTIVASKSRRSDRELSELRSEVERVSAVLMNAPMPTGEEHVYELLPARAA